MNNELEYWEGEGGTKYAARNEPTEAEITKRTLALSKIVTRIKPLPKSILEVGSGPGANLAALDRLFGESVYLFGCEPNESARKMSELVCPSAIINDGHASALPAADGTFDLVLTAGVLIHISPDRLSLAMDEIIRVSNRHIVCIEYFAPTCEPIKYYGDDRIWKNDFGKLYLEKGLKPVDSGFFWRQDSGYDNVVWSLLEK